MKKLLLHLLLKKAGARARIGKAIGIVAALSFAGVIVAGTLAVWAGVAAFDYATTAVTTVAAIEEPLLRPGCLEKARSMLSLSLWLESPLQLNFREIKNACVEKT